jgi:uncharacterized protein (DUF1499 family)
MTAASFRHAAGSHSLLGSTLILLLILITTSACSAQPPASPAAGGKLAPCPSAPHCVSSDDADAKHQIAALRIKGDADQAWVALKAELAKLPRAKMIEERADYRKVVVTTRIMRFKDDVEFLLRPDRGEIAMRSTSNVGYYDFNVNRNRLEAIRSALQAQGVVQ